jgi:hypothetical protein
MEGASSLPAHDPFASLFGDPLADIKARSEAHYDSSTSHGGYGNDQRGDKYSSGGDGGHYGARSGNHGFSRSEGTSEHAGHWGGFGASSSADRRSPFYDDNSGVFNGQAEYTTTRGDGSYVPSSFRSRHGTSRRNGTSSGGDKYRSGQGSSFRAQNQRSYEQNRNLGGQEWNDLPSRDRLPTMGKVEELDDEFVDEDGDSFGPVGVVITPNEGRDSVPK